jgi:hypothetical protein
MKRPVLITLVLGSLSLATSLAPAPRADDAEAATIKALAGQKAAVSRKIADFYADPRLAGLDPKGDSPSLAGMEQVEVWMRRSVDARLEAAGNQDERLAILQEDLERTRAIESRIKAVAEGTPGMAKIDSFKAEYYRLDSEQRLAREKLGR